jgi:hypothetical protein
MGGAGACPPGWTCQDIGGPASAGSQSYAGDGVWTVSGAGADIAGTSDQFHFVSQSLPANMTISAHVDAQTYTSDWAKAGLMIRASNAANAPFYDVTIAPGHNIRVEYRDTVGGATGLQASVASFAPAYIAIAHGGLTIYAFYSNDGVNWTMIPGSARNITALNTTTLVGMAVTSHSTTTVSTATLDNVNVMTNGARVCPTGWTCQDIGAPSPAGYQDFVGNGSWIVYGSGADIWGTSDQFHYVSQSLPGDGALTSRVGWQANTAIYAKARIMVRALDRGVGGAQPGLIPR